MEVVPIDVANERTNILQLPAQPPLRLRHDTLKSASPLYVVRNAANLRYILVSKK